ncbi:MAG: undecaprenyldiphospho-muramoylpentapeptide beta-N-acetylglucosaminyltransferase [Thiothrix sp.]|nr:undecaprenyldiphospho-muramoylpentapeptide beta-N-acetylglucosaminyltransferase [Thiothrix sp.]HPE59709.1 undecaprenyldiphospho-muramoylpentapeptide beta-N-acetylglucosaminyltransferase [Thiolinea sp.]
MTERRPVMIMAGGTGGHVYPGLAVARVLMEQGIPVVWMGTHAGLEARVIPEAGITMAWLNVTGLRGKGWQTLILAPVRLVMALFQSVAIMLRHKPAAILGMGGFVAGPGGAVGALMGRPLVIHEQNAVAGLTNRLLSVLSRRILEGFDGTFDKAARVEAVGNPVRRDIAALPSPEQRFAGRQGPVRLLVIGGSLGAAALNETVPAALALLTPDERPRVRHQAGSRNLDAASEAYKASAVTADVTAFITDMAEAYGWADLIICRAGALTVAEVAAAGLAAVFVPYPHAVDDHQTANAAYLVNQGAALLLPQSGLSAGKLAAVLRELCADRERLLTMGQRARQMARPDATATVASVCAAYAGYEFDRGKV